MSFQKKNSQRPQGSCHKQLFFQIKSNLKLRLKFSIKSSRLKVYTSRKRTKLKTVFNNQKISLNSWSSWNLKLNLKEMLILIKVCLRIRLLYRPNFKSTRWRMFLKYLSRRLKWVQRINSSKNTRKQSLWNYHENYIGISWNLISQK